MNGVWLLSFWFRGIDISDFKGLVCFSLWLLSLIQGFDGGPRIEDDLPLQKLNPGLGAHFGLAGLPSPLAAAVSSSVL